MKRDSLSNKSKRSVISESDIEDFLVEYKAYLKIDADALDEDLKTQSGLYHEVADRLALQVSRRDATKKALAEAEAFADERIRKRMRKKGDKFTEKEIATKVRSDEEVEELSSELLRIGYNVARLGALKDSFEQRRYMLREMVQSYVAGYWGDTMSSSSNSAMKERSAEETKKARKRHYRGEDRD